MHLIETVLLLLLAVVVSGSIARITRIALPLVQIGLGAAIVLITGKTVDLGPTSSFCCSCRRCCFWMAGEFPRKTCFATERSFSSWRWVWCCSPSWVWVS